MGCGWVSPAWREIEGGMQSGQFQSGGAAIIGKDGHGTSLAEDAGGDACGTLSTTLPPTYSRTRCDGGSYVQGDMWMNPVIEKSG